MEQAIRNLFDATSARLFGFKSAPKFYLEDDLAFHALLENDVTITELLSEQHCLTIDDLPPIGMFGTVYKVSDTLDMYVWTGEHYVTHNPYDETRSGRPLITDHTAFMPAGGSLRSSLVYSVWALREDLRRMHQYGWKMAEQIKGGHHLSTVPMITQWFRSNHTQLASNLRKAVNGAGVIEQHVLDGLHSIGVHLWYDKESRQLGFKDGAFSVLF